MVFVTVRVHPDFGTVFRKARLVRQADQVMMMTEVINVHEAKTHLSRLLDRVLAGGKSIADRVGFSRFPSPMLVDKLTEDMAVSGDKIKRDLGYVPQYDLRSGWKQTLNEIGGGK